MKHCGLIIIILFLASCNNNRKLGYETDEFENSSSFVISNEKNTPYEEEDTVVSDLSTDSRNIHSNLTEKFSNNNFSIRYPSSWEIVQQNVQATPNTKIAVQIMQKKYNNFDFRPNVNIIVSSDKHSESSSYLARLSYNQVKEIGLAEKLIGIKEVQLGKYKGSVAEYIANIEGYKLRVFQYIIKKADNTPITITVTLDNTNLTEQQKVSQEIIDSLVIY